MPQVLEASSAAPTYDFSQLDLTPVTTNFTAVLAVAVPFALGVLSIRKGISLLFGMIRGA